VEISSRVEAEEEAEDLTVGLEMEEMQVPTTETSEEIIASVEGGEAPDAFGETAESEMKAAGSE
jgi:hypothetical protein